MWPVTSIKQIAGNGLLGHPNHNVLNPLLDLIILACQIILTTKLKIVG
jgi:hypothetical protein